MSVQSQDFSPKKMPDSRLISKELNLDASFYRRIILKFLNRIGGAKSPRKRRGFFLCDCPLRISIQQIDNMAILCVLGVHSFVPSQRLRGRIEEPQKMSGLPLRNRYRLLSLRPNPRHG